MSEIREPITLYATIRDFPANHPDFERDEFTGEITGLEPKGSSAANPEKGIVEAELGVDGKPRYSNGEQNKRKTTTGEASFDEWFGRSKGNYNTIASYPLEFVYENGCYRFERRDGFFPLDGRTDTFGNLYDQMFKSDGTLTNVGREVIDRNLRDREKDEAFFHGLDGKPLTREGLCRIYQEWNNDRLTNQPKAKLHNYHFTLEVKTEFTYQGNEFFEFYGDDDLWVFIDNLLVIDLGGLHRSAQQKLNLQIDASQHRLEFNLQEDLKIAHAPKHLNLVLEKGKTYPLHIFYAERHTFDSTCCFYTSLKIQPPVIPSKPQNPIIYDPNNPNLWDVDTERVFCFAPIRTVVRREEEIVVIRRVRKVEEVDASPACPINSIQIAQVQQS
jgi:fibro-slime domain-containing protein